MLEEAAAFDDVAYRHSCCNNQEMKCEQRGHKWNHSSYGEWLDCSHASWGMWTDTALAYMHLSEVFMTMNKLTKCLYRRNRSCEGTWGRRSVAKGHWHRETTAPTQSVCAQTAPVSLILAHAWYERLRSKRLFLAVTSLWCGWSACTVSLWHTFFCIW